MEISASCSLGLRKGEEKATGLAVSHPARPWGAPRFSVKLAATFALLAGIPASLLAQVNIEITGYDEKSALTQYIAAKVCNETTGPITLMGWKFRSQSFSGWTSQWGVPALTVDGANPSEYTQIISTDQQKVQTGNCSPANAASGSVPVVRDYSGTPSAGQSAIPFDPQILVKTGTCSEVPPYTDAPPLACADIEAQRALPAFYGAQCLIDTIGANGGNQFGGFVSTWNGQSQIQAALPNETITISNTPVRWNPYSMGPQYMMALGMVQEVMNVDMQFLIAIAGKETGAGMVNQATGKARSEDGSYVDNGTYGYWQIEQDTYGTYIKAYPQFFPEYGACISKYRDVTSAIPTCAPGWGEVAKHYMQPKGKTRMESNDPQIANGALSSAIAWYGLYDALSLSTDLCFKEAVSEGIDKKIAFAAMIPGYNLGRWNPSVDALKDPNLKNDPNASEKFPMGNNNYRKDVFAILDALVNASRANKAACGARPIYDTAISITEVQKFFFGGSVVPGTPAAQGDGGLLLHFDLSPAARQTLWTDIQCAFGKLKGKAPSNPGAENISYRYDWLSILRIAKKHFPVNIMDRQIPVEHDFEHMVEVNSTGKTTCSGKIKDDIFPALTITSPKQGSVIAPLKEGFKVTFDSRDIVPGSAAAAVAKAEWTLDKNWNSWNAATKAGGNSFEFLVSCERPDYPAEKGKPAALWVRTTDDCGNTIVQKLAFTTHSKANCGEPPLPPEADVPEASPPGAKFSALSAGIQVTLKDGTPGATILYTLNGDVPDTVVGGSTKAYATGAVLTFTATTTLKARAIAPDHLPSPVGEWVFEQTIPGKTQTPEALPPGRAYSGSLKVELVVKGRPAAAIFYTLDGTEPDTMAGGSTLKYAGALDLGSAIPVTVVKAKALEKGFYPSQVMTETYTYMAPVAVSKAWYLDENGDGRIEKAMVVFDKPLTAVPQKLGFTVQTEANEQIVKTAAQAEMALVPGDPTQVAVTFAQPFPFGVTSLKNSATSGQTYQQEGPYLSDGLFAVADSVPPALVRAKVVQGDTLTQFMSQVTLTYSESVKVPLSSQTAWVVKRISTEITPAEMRISSAKTDLSGATVLLIDTISTLMPIPGDSVSLNIPSEIPDFTGNMPKLKRFVVLEGEAPKAKPVRFAILFPNSSTDRPSKGSAANNGPQMFIPLDKNGNALAGSREAGRCAGCVARDQAGFVGPVFKISTPGALRYQFRIFTNTGDFVGEGGGRIEDQELDQLTKDKVGRNYELPVVWTGMSRGGRKAGTGAYIVLADFILDKDLRTGAGPSKQTDKKVFGLLRN